MLTAHADTMCSWHWKYYLAHKSSNIVELSPCDVIKMYDRTELERIVLSIYVRQNCPGGQCKRMRRVTSEKMYILQNIVSESKTLMV